jgi:hypothetical protein
LSLPITSVQHIIRDDQCVIQDLNVHRHFGRRRRNTDFGRHDIGPNRYNSVLDGRLEVAAAADHGVGSDF